MVRIAFARADFETSARDEILLSVIPRVVELFALEASRPRKSPGLRFLCDFGINAFSWEGFVGHHIIPGSGRRVRTALSCTTGNLCVPCADNHSDLGAACDKGFALTMFSVSLAEVAERFMTVNFAHVFSVGQL